MPSFFAFHQGNESGARFNNDAAPLLGRFRAVPDQNTLRNKQSVGDLFSSFTGGSVERGSFGGGYGSIWRTRSGGNTTDADGEWDGWGPEEGRLRRWWRIIEDIWIKPQKDAVGLVLDRWWARWLIMVVLPAAVAVIWCAIPFPQYPLDWDDDWDDTGGGDGDQSHIPGHGEARVQVNFWFFLFVFYGFYNITALMWITKVFNIYSLNW